MKTTRGEVSKLRARLAEAVEALRAIRGGEVDAVIVAGKQGPQVFTLEGAEHAYRLLIESMNEGALTLTDDKTILFANRCFADMVKLPLEQVTGGSFRRFLAEEDRFAVRPLLKRGRKTGSKTQVVLHARDGSRIPVNISIRPLAKNGSQGATFGMVVTDMTEAKRNEESLRALAQRVLQAQETERRRIALELHDGITQSLCAIAFRSHALMIRLTARGGAAQEDAKALCKMAGKAAEELELISRDLRPSVLDQLGLMSALRQTTGEFTARTGISVKLACAKVTAQLPGDAELTLYRILQEALRNVEKHARTRYVTVNLTQPGAFVQLRIRDDGIGFDPERRPARRKNQGGLGLFGMRERVHYAGGTLKVTSAPGAGAEIKVRIPV